ncbi:MAG TPA: squalene/phytoene synthase family protein, partial [Microbacteriaceae bacterium]|nr:squalene/phytoene synthase family protein [Microbacteriaceae bacterium]
DATAEIAAAPVIRRYSNSFRMAASLFPRRTRGAIGSIYALVRVADEIVDGTAEEAGLDRTARGQRLDELEAEVARAIATGFSANLIVHAFANVARRSGMAPEPIADFFSSMRRDLDPVAFDAVEYQTYIRGSAEAVGLMCLAVFLQDRETPAEDLAALEAGAARLGAAFQKVNFLRDLGHDADRLGRAYLPGMEATGLSDVAKADVITDIRADLDAARAAIPKLPRDTRRAVRVATGIFAELLRRLDRLPAERVASARVSVPAVAKLMIATRCTLLPGRP